MPGATEDVINEFARLLLESEDASASVVSTLVELLSSSSNIQLEDLVKAFEGDVEPPQ